MSLRLARAALVLGLLALSRPESAFAEKTDLVILRNGDHITGEVKGVSRGKLDYSTDDAGRLSIEWVKVARVTSPNPYDIQLNTGARYFGRLGPPGRDGFLVVHGRETDSLRLESVIEITPLSAKFTQRVKSYLDLGFTLAKANQATTFSMSGSMDYRGPKIGTEFSFDSYAQGQESIPTTRRNTLQQSVSWYLPDRWSAVGLAQLEQNDELDLDYRFTGGGAMNRVINQSNDMEISCGAGVVGTQEQFTSDLGTSSSTNLEGLLVANWDAFRYDSPKLDFSTSLALFPSISQAGRVRGQTQIRLQYELFKDFEAGIRLTDTFDSRPADESATKNDYVTTFTIGWSYRR